MTKNRDKIVIRNKKIKNKKKVIFLPHRPPLAVGNQTHKVIFTIQMNYVHVF